MISPALCLPTCCHFAAKPKLYKTSNTKAKEARIKFNFGHFQMSWGKKGAPREIQNIKMKNVAAMIIAQVHDNLVKLF